ncbi:MAG: lysylphosphatidylglycerol synthase transmembrane domain-containing protein [Polyangiales bacterium]
MSVVQERIEQPLGSSSSAERPRRGASTLRRWLPLLGFGLLAWVLSRLDLHALGRAVGRVTPLTLVLSCTYFTINAYLKVWRWQRLLKAQGIVLPHRVALASFFNALFYAQITIGRVGEFLRIEALTERGVRPGTALSSCVFDRLLDVLWVLFSGLVLGVLWLGDLRIALVVGVVLIGLFIGGTALLALFGRDDSPALSSRFAQSRWGKRIVGFTHELASGIRPMLRPRALAEAALWTVVAWYFYFAALFVLSDGLHIAVPRLLLTATAAFAALTSLLPVTISGLGAREVIYIEVLRSHGVPSETAVAVSLLHLAVMTAMAIGLGLCGVAWRARQRK